MNQSVGAVWQVQNGVKPENAVSKRVLEETATYSA